MLATPDASATMSNFMRDFASTVARRIGAHREYEGKFWARRYRCIPTTDEAAVEERFAYMLCQGTKENLVMRADEWPGLCPIRALRGGPPMIGRWRDKAAENELKKQRARKIERAAGRGEVLEFGAMPKLFRDYPIELVPLPHWQGWKPGRIAQRVADIVNDDAAKTRARHKRNKTRPLGVAGILRTDPMSAPRESKKSPAPLCHASNHAQRRAFRAGYGSFCQQVKHANRALMARRRDAGVPEGSIAAPVASANVVVNRTDVRLTFQGGDERLHFDPYDAKAIFRGEGRDERRATTPEPPEQTPVVGADQGRGRDRDRGPPDAQ